MSAATAAQKSMEHSQEELSEVIEYYNANPLDPKVFPAHARKLLDTVSSLAFVPGQEERMAGRLVRMSDPDKISFVCRAYLAEASTRRVDTHPGLLYAFLNRYYEHVTPEHIDARAQAEQEKAEALAEKAEEAARKAAEKEAKKAASAAKKAATAS